MNPASFEAELAQLRAGSEPERRAAIDALAAGGDLEAVWPLAQIVGAPEEGEAARVAAATALLRMNPRSYAHLVALLDTLDPQARGLAYLALALIGDDGQDSGQDLVVRWLNAFASHPDPVVLHALETFVEALVQQPDFDMKLVWGEVSLYDPYAPNDASVLPWVSVADRRFGLGWGERYYIVWRIVPLAIPALMRALACDRSEQACWLVYSLIDKRSTAWPFAELARAVRYSIPGNLAIARLLAPSGSHALAIVSALTDPQLVGDLASAPIEWQRVLEQLGRLLDALVERLGHSDAAVRRNALVPLCRLRDKRVVPPLLRALADPDAGVRARAAHRLGDFDLAKPVQAADAAPQLLAVLADPDAGVRANAARALEATGDSRALGPLIAALSDPVDEVRADAAAALRAFSGDRTVVALVAALADPAVAVARQAVGSLGRIKAVEPLIGAVDHPDADVRSRAIGLLGSLDRDERALEPIIAALHDPAAKVRTEAAWALSGKYRDARALEPLLAALSNVAEAHNEQVALTTALTRLQDRRAVAPLMAALESPSAVVRVAAVELLGALGAREVVPQLVAALADPEEGVRHKIVDTLKGFGNRQAIVGLCAALRDPDRPVRERAEHTLREFLGLRLVWPLFRCVLRERDPAVRQRVRAAAIRVLLGMESR